MVTHRILLYNFTTKFCPASVGRKTGLDAGPARLGSLLEDARLQSVGVENPKEIFLFIKLLRSNKAAPGKLFFGIGIF